MDFLCHRNKQDNLKIYTEKKNVNTSQNKQEAEEERWKTHSKTYQGSRA